MIKFLVKESADGSSLEATNVTFHELQAEFPNRMFSRPFVPAQFEGTRFSVVEMPTKPAVSFGQTVEPQFTKENGAWVGAWTIITSASLSELKSQLRDLAAAAAWQKSFVDYRPSVATVVAAGLDMEQVRLNRVAQINALLPTVATNIDNASTIEEAYAVYKQIENFE